MAAVKTTVRLPGLAAPAVALLLWVATGCSVLEDNGTHLADALERRAQHLASSNRNEEVVEYEPLTGINQSYYIEMTPSDTTQAPYGGYLVVSGKNSGGTSYHGRFVYTPKRLYITKTNAGARLTLRKNGDRIEVVDLQEPKRPKGGRRAFASCNDGVFS